MDNFICPRGQKNWLFLRGSHCGEVAVSGGLSVITCYSFHSFHLSLQINLTVNYASPSRKLQPAPVQISQRQPSKGATMTLGTLF